MEAKSKKLTSKELRKLFPNGVPHADVRFVSLNGKTFLFSHSRRERVTKYDEVISAEGLWWGIVRSPRHNDLDLAEPVYCCL